MFAKTVCKPGAYLCVVPLGLLTTLQYNSRGVLEKILNGYGDDSTTLSKDVFDMIVSNKLVPSSIPIQGGTTWISGAFYTSTEFYDEGTLPDCIQTSIVADIKKNPNNYSFYAGHIDSLAASFQAVITARNWLSMSKFNVLPGYVIPDKLTESAFIHMVNNARFPFKFPLISGYMIWEGSNYRYYPLGLKQFTASKVVKAVDKLGYVKGVVQSNSSEVSLTLNYSDVVAYNIQTATNILYESNKVIYSTCTDNKRRDPRSSKLTCPICGKTYEVPKSGTVMCDDVHCLSRSYPDICHMLKVLDLPELSYDNYIKYVKCGEITYIPDIFLLPEYKDAEVVTSLSKLLQAATPVSVCSDSTIFTLIASRCANSIKTLKYYMNNPDRLKIELNINSLLVNRWIDWIEDAYNVRMIETLIESVQISIDNTSKKFEGAPIFRDKKIALTGKFRHGDMEEVMSILRSYDADVVTDVDNSVDCLIVGSLKEDIDGRCLRYAKSANICIFDEEEFFNKYDIDTDLEENLL